MHQGNYEPKSPLDDLIPSAFWLTAFFVFLFTEPCSSIFSLRLSEMTLTANRIDPIRILGMLTFLLFCYRFRSGLKRLRACARLHGYPMTLIDLPQCLFKLKQLPSNTVYFGQGFVWTPEVARSAYALSKIDVGNHLPPPWFCRILLGRALKDPKTIGCGWLHGLAEDEKAISLPQKTLEGGTLIVGTTQSGKGVLLTLLITQAIVRREAVIVIDPKNSPRTLRVMDCATSRVKRNPALCFHPNSNVGIRLNPLANFSRLSELASRITACLNETGPFAAFAWKAIFVAATLIAESGEPLNLVTLTRTVKEGPARVLFQLASRRFGESALQNALALSHGRSERERLALAIESLLNNIDATPCGEDVLAEGLFLLKSDPEHEAKLTASLLPLLLSLTAGELRESLSPEAENPLRDKTTLSEIIEKKDVLYVATDALADTFTARAVSTLLLADLASLAADRYNKRKPPMHVSVFIDEASNAMSDALIELLNKGAESGIQVTCAMQTVSDLSARLGGDAPARMALGNFNNLIALRTKDLETARFVTETFGKTTVPDVLMSRSSSSASDSVGRFSAGSTRRLSVSREELVAPEWLGRLPNTEFFASLAGGRIIKGRVPILISDCD